MRYRRTLIAAGSVVLLLLAACGAPAALHQAATASRAPTITSSSLSSTRATAASTAASSTGTPATPSPLATPALVAATPTRLPAATPRAVETNGVLQPFSEIHMVTAAIGWAVGGGWVVGLPIALYRTTDGGAHWADVTPPGFALSDQGVQFLDAHSAVTEVRQSDGGLVLFHTVDGGRRWTATPELHSAVSGAFSTLPIGFTFLDSQHGWFSTSGGGMFSNLWALFQTADGGQHWTNLATKLPISAILGFSSPTTGWATDAHAGSAFATLGAAGTTAGELYVTHDSGRNWQYEQLPLLPDETADQPVQLLGRPQLTRSDGTLPELVHAGGRIKETSLEMYQTHDGGQTWTTTPLLPLGPTHTAGVVDLLGVRDGWAVAGTALATTRDGGAHWTTFTPTGITLNANGYALRALDFVSANTGWALDIPPSNLATWSLLQTRDGGHTWRRLLPALLPAHPVSTLPQTGAGGLAGTAQPASSRTSRTEGRESK